MLLEYLEVGILTRGDTSSGFNLPPSLIKCFNIRACFTVGCERELTLPIRSSSLIGIFTPVCLAYSRVLNSWFNMSCS